MLYSSIKAELWTHHAVQEILQSVHMFFTRITSEQSTASILQSVESYVAVVISDNFYIQ